MIVLEILSNSLLLIARPWARQAVFQQPANGAPLVPVRPGSDGTRYQQEAIAIPLKSVAPHIATTNPGQTDMGGAICRYLFPMAAVASAGIAPSPASDQSVSIAEYGGLDVKQPASLDPESIPSLQP